MCHHKPFVFLAPNLAELNHDTKCNELVRYGKHFLCDGHAVKVLVVIVLLTAAEMLLSLLLPLLRGFFAGGFLDPGCLLPIFLRLRPSDPCLFHGSDSTLCDMSVNKSLRISSSEANGHCLSCLSCLPCLGNQTSQTMQATNYVNLCM